MLGNDLFCEDWLFFKRTMIDYAGDYDRSWGGSVLWWLSMINHGHTMIDHSPKQIMYLLHFWAIY